MNTHECKFDDRGICEQCTVEQRKHDHWKDVYEPVYNILRAPIPENLEEFPTPYEFGQMEDGNWD